MTTIASTNEPVEDMAIARLLLLLAGDDAAKPPAERSARAERTSQQPGFIAGAFAAGRTDRRYRRQDPPVLPRELHCISEDRSERLDIVPAQFRAGHPTTQICLADLRGWPRACPGASARAACLPGASVA